jgi:hypothetical protein
MEEINIDFSRKDIKLDTIKIPTRITVQSFLMGDSSNNRDNFISKIIFL